MEARSFMVCECFRGPDFGVSRDTEVQVVGDEQEFIGSLSSQVVQQSTSTSSKTVKPSIVGKEMKERWSCFHALLCYLEFKGCLY